MATQKGTRKTKKTKETTPTPKKVTKVAFVVDRSGSMNTVREQAFASINGQLKTIRENADKGGDTRVWYVQFDDVIEVLRTNEEAKSVQDVKWEEYVPRNSTALWDATGKAISVLQDSGVDSDDTAFLVIVISDGYENASREWNQISLSKKIKDLEATGKWTFSWMLSNVDVHSFARQLNVNLGSIASYTSSPRGVVSSSYAMTASAANFMDFRKRGVTATANFYGASIGQSLDMTMSDEAEGIIKMQNLANVLASKKKQLDALDAMNNDLDAGKNDSDEEA